MKETNPAVTYEIELGKRDKSILITVFLHFSDSQDSDARLKVKDFQLKLTIKNVKFSIESMMEIIKLVVLIKDEFDYVDISILMGTFEIFGLSKIWTRENYDLFFKKTLIHV